MDRAAPSEGVGCGFESRRGLYAAECKVVARRAFQARDIGFESRLRSPRPYGPVAKDTGFSIRRARVRIPLRVPALHSYDVPCPGSSRCGERLPYKQEAGGSIPPPGTDRHRGLAQSAAQLTLNQKAPGSIPGSPTEEWLGRLASARLETGWANAVLGVRLPLLPPMRRTSVAEDRPHKPSDAGSSPAAATLRKVSGWIRSSIRNRVVASRRAALGVRVPHLPLRSSETYSSLVTRPGCYPGRTSSGVAEVRILPSPVRVNEFETAVLRI